MSDLQTATEMARVGAESIGALTYPEPPLRDGTVGLRRWELSDIPLVKEAAGDQALLRGTTLPRVYTAARAVAFVERQWSRQARGEGVSLVITFSGEPVGCATLIVRRPAIADLGYWLLERVRGHGIGGRAIDLFVAWGLRQSGVAHIEAFVADDNVPSTRLLQSAGFTHIGRARHRVADVDEELLVYRRTPRSRRRRVC